MTRRILVLDGEQRSALAVVRSLGRSGATVHVASRHPRPLAGASRYCAESVRMPDPLAHADEYVDAVETAAQRFGADFILPVTDASHLAILPARARIPACVPCVDDETFRRVSDKETVLAEAREVGIAVPRHVRVSCVDDPTVATAESLTFPIVIKPARSVALRTSAGLRVKLGVSYASNPAELRTTLRALPAEAFPVLLQERIVGPGSGVFLLVWDGALVASFAHRRLRENPPSGGVSVLCESVAMDAALLEASRALLRRFEWRGVAMVEYKTDVRSGTPYLMEINGRFWGSLQLAIDSGVDFPSLLVAAAAGEKPAPVHHYQTGVRSRWWWGDVDHLIARARRSETELALPPGAPGRLAALGEFLRPTRAGYRNEIFRLDDPRPFLRETLDRVGNVRVPNPPLRPIAQGGRAPAAPRVPVQTGARRTRVLHVVLNLNYGGMERVVSDIVRFTDSDAFETHVLCLRYLGHNSEGLETFARFHLAPRLERTSMVWPRALAQAMRDIAPDVVHTHSGVWYKASLAARFAGVRRVVHTEHGRAHFDPPTHRVLDGIAALRTDTVVAVSDVLAGYLKAKLRISPRRIAVVRNGIDTEAYRPRPDNQRVRAEIGVAADVPILGSIGRLEHVKGYDVMIHSYKALVDLWDESAGPLPHLVIAGDGSERPMLERLVRELDLAARVHLLGWRDDPQDLHAAFNVFTLSSRSEGTSISVLEAMSAGLCPVVTDVGGNRVVLGPDLANRLVPSENPAALARAWVNALTDHETRSGNERAARARVQEEFSVTQMVRDYERIYAA